MMFLWQVGGNGGQTRQSGGLVEGYRRYHHGHSTDIADLLVIGAAEYGAIHGVIWCYLSGILCLPRS